MRFAPVLPVLALGLVACSSAGGPADTAISPDLPGDILPSDLPDVPVPGDLPDAGPDIGPITGLVPLRVGVASRPIPAPVGISTAGFFWPAGSSRPRRR